MVFCRGFARMVADYKAKGLKNLKSPKKL